MQNASLGSLLQNIEQVTIAFFAAYTEAGATLYAHDVTGCASGTFQESAPTNVLPEIYIRFFCRGILPASAVRANPPHPQS